MAARHARSLTKRQLRKPWLCALKLKLRETGRRFNPKVPAKLQWEAWKVPGKQRWSSWRHAAEYSLIMNRTYYSLILIEYGFYSTYIVTSISKFEGYFVSEDLAASCLQAAEGSRPCGWLDQWGSLNAATHNAVVPPGGFRWSIGSGPMPGMFALQLVAILWSGTWGGDQIRGSPGDSKTGPEGAKDLEGLQKLAIRRADFCFFFWFFG